MKVLTIIVMTLAIAFMADRLAREENQRWALEAGFCPPPTSRNATADTAARACLETVQTRPTWLWQAYEGLTTPLPAVPLKSGVD